jgi:EAL domain-containing protein (putative c-di-GMP-specific phosphodiesterase class I)/GGDEF domain-containing protein
MARALKTEDFLAERRHMFGPALPTRAEAPLWGMPARSVSGHSRRRHGEIADNGPLALTAWRLVALADIANFAGLRRHLGRLSADRLVEEVIARASECLPGLRGAVAGRTLAEFDLGTTDFGASEEVIETLRTAFAKPFDLDGESHHLEITLAAAAAPVGSTEDVRLVEEAEGALEQARIDFRAVIRDLSTGTPAFDRLSLIRELPEAIARGEMFLQYQPKVHVRRQEIASAEALVRWQHPQRGLILPGDFITIAEESRQIGALTLWTLDQVIADQRILRADGRDLTVFINISGQLLSDADFVATACRKVRDCGAKIGFEITETAVIRDPQSAIANLRKFDEVGITIAIDDYGAGLSSLAYLKQLPARELKIDKMFILQLTSSNRDPLIVRSTIDLAHALEMEVTAEGVETQAALALLTVMGCDMVQGYLLSRPISIDAFRQFLRDDNLKLGGDGRDSMFKRPASFWRTA